MAKQGNLNDQDVYKQGIYAREELSTTGIGEGIAIPHAQSEAVNAPGLAAMVVKDPITRSMKELTHLLFHCVFFIKMMKYDAT